MSKFETKNGLFEYFWAGILKHKCHIRNQHPRICLTAKFCETKLPKFGTNNALIGYFWARISTLEFVKNESLHQTVNFGIGPNFLKFRVRV